MGSEIGVRHLSHIENAQNHEGQPCSFGVVGVIASLQHLFTEPGPSRTAWEYESVREATAGTVDLWDGGVAHYSSQWGSRFLSQVEVVLAVLWTVFV